MHYFSALWLKDMRISLFFCQGGHLLTISQLKLVINHPQPFLSSMPLYSQPSFNSIILTIFSFSKLLKCWDIASSSEFPSTSIPVQFTTSDILAIAWYLIAGGYHQWWGYHCHLAGDPAPKSYFGFCFLRLWLAPTFAVGSLVTTLRWRFIESSFGEQLL